MCTPEVAPLKRDGPFPEFENALTQRRTWILLVGFCASLVLTGRWPNIFGFIWELSLLCCFPAGLFVWAAISSGAVHKPPMGKIVIIIVALHGLLLAGTVYLWSRDPKSITGDFGFGFVVIEVAAIWLLTRFARPNGKAQDSQKRSAKISEGAQFNSEGWVSPQLAERKARRRMVGTGRFELPTPRTPSECSTRLSHVPTWKKSADPGSPSDGELHSRGGVSGQFYTTSTVAFRICSILGNICETSKLTPHNTRPKIRLSPSNLRQLSHIHATLRIQVQEMRPSVRKNPEVFR